MDFTADESPLLVGIESRGLKLLSRRDVLIDYLGDAVDDFDAQGGDAQRGAGQRACEHAPHVGAQVLTTGAAHLHA